MQDTIELLIDILLLRFSDVLDCVDGEITRATKTESIQGIFLDKLAHGCCRVNSMIKENPDARKSSCSCDGIPGVKCFEPVITDC
jgi:hypothetical protein